MFVYPYGKREIKTVAVNWAPRVLCFVRFRSNVSGDAVAG